MQKSNVESPARNLRLGSPCSPCTRPLSLVQPAPVHTSKKAKNHQNPKNLMPFCWEYNMFKCFLAGTHSYCPYIRRKMSTYDRQKDGDCVSFYEWRDAAPAVCRAESFPEWVPAAESLPPSEGLPSMTVGARDPWSCWSNSFESLYMWEYKRVTPAHTCALNPPYHLLNTLGTVGPRSFHNEWRGSFEQSYGTNICRDISGICVVSNSGWSNQTFLQILSLLFCNSFS